MQQRAFDEVLVAAENHNVDVRRFAAVDLGKLARGGDLRAIPVLLRMLADGGDYVDEAASDALASIGEPAVVPLIELLWDREANPRSRGWAARTLGTIQAPDAFEPMAAVLADTDEDPEVQRMVAFYLGRLGDRRAVEPLTAAMTSPVEDLEVRKNAAYALGELGDRRAFEALLASLQDARIGNWVGSALEELRDERAVAALFPTFGDEDEEWRYRVAPIVGKAGPSAIGPLLEALRSEDWRVRATAARALSYSEADAAVGPLIEVLEKDENEIVRAEAATALGFLNGDQIVSALLGGLRDAAVDVRRASAWGLHHLATLRKVGRDVIPTLEDVAASDRTEVNGRLVVRELLHRVIDQLNR
ncbi:MAG TPA: HEAT repeat domain-containing protein [Chloroflexota bacterium]|nr:HEAT repeat domain-containing protein [Chloroflexota bacterium]